MNAVGVSVKVGSLATVFCAVVKVETCETMLDALKSVAMRDMNVSSVTVSNGCLTLVNVLVSEATRLNDSAKVLAKV